MIVRDIMTTHLVTVTPGDTLAHAATLLRQHQFHHLPVVRRPQGSRSRGRDILRNRQRTSLQAYSLLTTLILLQSTPDMIVQVIS